MVLLEGQTRKIANFLKAETEKLGHQVVLADSTDNPPAPSGYDLVLIGASVHAHKYQSAVIHYAKSNSEALNKIKSGFFSVSLAAIDEGRDDESWQELSSITRKFLEDTGWKPVHVEQVAGALLYTQYDFLKKFIMRLIAKRHGITDKSDREYTNWTKVKTFLEKMLKT